MQHDEPFVKLDDARQSLLSVSPDVNTKAYHDAFMKMPLPKPVAEAVYIQAGRILGKAAGKDEEYLVAIDARTGELVADNLGRDGHSRNTIFVGDELRKVQDHEQQVVVIHNHPHNLAPSFQDVMTASKNGAVAASVVLGHDGDVWFVSASSRNIADELGRFYNETKDELGDEAELRALDRLIGRAGKMGLIWLKLR